MEEEGQSSRQLQRVTGENLQAVAAGISDFLGNGCEVSLYSLDEGQMILQDIYNGFHSGCYKNASPPQRIRSLLHQLTDSRERGHITEFMHTQNGEPLKTTVIGLKNPAGDLWGALCIDMYLNTPLHKMLDQFMPPKAAGSTQALNGVEDMIDRALRQTRKRVLADTCIPQNMKNREIIAELYEKGIFNIKDAVVRIASSLDISKNTVYMHLRNFSSAQDS